VINVTQLSQMTWSSVMVFLFAARVSYLGSGIGGGVGRALFARDRFLWALLTDSPLLAPSDASFVAAV
jgi:hypothetical protein